MPEYITICLKALNYSYGSFGFSASSNVSLKKQILQIITIDLKVT